MFFGSASVGISGYQTVSVDISGYQWVSFGLHAIVSLNNSVAQASSGVITTFFDDLRYFGHGSGEIASQS